MGNRVIPLKDRAVVVERLAQGASTRDAIKGTSIKSNHTAARLAKSQSHIIAQFRQNYLEAIEAAGQLTLPDRARLWGDMARATKFIRSSKAVGYGLDKAQMTMHLMDAPIVEEVPDWRARERALRYIDSLAEKVNGAAVGSKVQINLIKDADNFSLSN